jgi:hypothetical protein
LCCATYGNEGEELAMKYMEISVCCYKIRV